MAWIEIHQTLPRHKKTLATAGRLSVDRFTIVGHLVELWTWGIDNVPSDGYLGNISDESISIAAGWAGDPTEFARALIDAGYIDKKPDGLYLHDWFEYAGKLLIKREKEKERSKARRATGKKPSDNQRSTDGRPQERPMVDREKLRGTVPYLSTKYWRDDARAREEDQTLLSAHLSPNESTDPVTRSVDADSRQPEDSLERIEVTRRESAVSPQPKYDAPERTDATGGLDSPAGSALPESEVSFGTDAEIEDLAFSVLGRLPVREEIVMAERLMAEGVPKAVVLQGIRDSIKKFKPKHELDRIRSLHYCEPMILQLNAALQKREEVKIRAPTRADDRPVAETADANGRPRKWYTTVDWTPPLEGG